MARKQASGQWTTVIRPKRSWFAIDFKSIWQYRDLVWLRVKRNFTIMYRQTILGPMWILLQPLLTTVIFTVVFGNIAGLPTDGMPQFLFYMAGNITWHFFSSCLTSTSKTFVENRNLFGKVYFPRLCMPLSVVASELMNFFVQFAMFMVFLLIYALKPNPTVHPDWRLILLTPVMLLQLGMMGLGFGIIVAALTTKYRDLSMLVTFGVQLWMYATPVTYSSSMIAEKFPQLLNLYMLNPITPVIELFRAAYLGAADYSLKYNLLSLGVTAVVMMIGIMLFTHVEKTFMDTV